MTKKTMMEQALESPALKERSTMKGELAYPASWGDKVPLRVRMKETVTPDLVTLVEPAEGTVCVQGNEYYVWVNSYGAVCAILENGEHLGIKPDEFEVTEWHKQEATPPMDKFIVAEVSKSWKANDPVSNTLGQQFEEIINVNLSRGYILSDWKLGQVCNGDVFTETIIAIFEKIE